MPTRKGKLKMTLEEFKAYVEMRQKISLEEALSRLKPKEA
jgi:hypothetical protein